MVVEVVRNYRELIETLWNVNDIIGVQKMVTRPGINRNIVECKF